MFFIENKLIQVPETVLLFYIHIFINKNYSYLPLFVEDSASPLPLLEIEEKLCSFEKTYSNTEVRI